MWDNPRLLNAAAGALTALALLVISFPSYLAFNWDFVLLFLVLGGLVIYLQAAIRQ